MRNGSRDPSSTGSQGGRRYRRSPDVAHRVIDGRAVVVVPATQALHTLNEVGSFIWQACDGKTVEELVAAVVAEFSVGEVAARADIGAFISELVEKRMLMIE